MKIRKTICVLATAGMLLTLTACSNGTKSAQTNILGATFDDYNLEAKIAFVNSTAASIRNHATNFIVRADAAKQSIRGTTKLAVVKCNVNNGKCEVSVSGGSDTVQFGSGEKVKWTGDNTESSFDIFLENALDDSTPIYAEIYIKNGTVLGVVAVPNGSASDIPEVLRNEDVWSSGEINWSSGKMGIGANGVVIGTSPVIVHKQN